MASAWSDSESDTDCCFRNGKVYRSSPLRERRDLLHDIELDTSSGVMKGVLKKTGGTVAIKSVQISCPERREQFLKEFKVLHNPEIHANLVQCYECRASKHSATVHMLMELMDLGNLRDLLERIGKNGEMGVPPQMLACITRQIMTGLEHLHNRKILHRSFKPENILHNSAGEVKLADFGMPASLDDLGLCHPANPCFIYISPERALGEDYSFLSDIWSVGMVIYELASGHHPYSDIDTFPGLFEALCENPEPRLDESEFPSELCDFVAGCLTRDVDLRSSAHTLCCHPFANSELLQVLTVYIELLPAEAGICVTCCDLGGSEQFKANLEIDAKLERLESHLREKFPGHRELLGEDGASLVAEGLVKDSGASLTLTVAHAALVQYLASLVPPSAFNSSSP